jgi:hypothetical protein
VNVSTDKTQLTLFRNKSAYPIYLTIGNIPKEIRRRPSSHAYVLLGYIPTTRLEHITNAASRRRQLANLYHACMGRALKSLEAAGRDGVSMTTGDGSTYRGHPLLACVINDYLEQILTTCISSGQCPTCPTPPDEFGTYNPPGSTSFRDLGAILGALDSFDDDPAGFLKTCKTAGVKPVVNPFWKNLPYVHIYRSITPDVLHQLYQGVMKHLIGWVIQACGADEIDARCRRMPPNHNIRLFMKGISTLSRVSGQEHDYMCRILMGLVIGVPLDGGLSSARLLRCVRALLDFLYLAQYPIHTEETLRLLDDALKRFHASKDIFIELGIRESFNIPKLHWACHYVAAIRLYGTTDNVNTQYTERLHIDFAKDAYEATNGKDELSQMTIWLERKEKIHRHAQYIAWRLRDSCRKEKTPEPAEWVPPGLELDRIIYLSKHPTLQRVTFDELGRYGAHFFRTALARWIIRINEPNLNTAQIERRLWTIHIPFRGVRVWHRLKFLRTDPVTGLTLTADSVHARPESRDTRGRVVPGRFDTVLVNDGTGDTTGLKGLAQWIKYMLILTYIM